MNNKKLILQTVYVSLFFQIIIGIISAGGLFIELKPKDYILRDVLLIETIVQIIEAIFYVYIMFAMYDVKENTIASRRYADWVITTPIMLLSTVMFMAYEIKKSMGKSISTKEFLVNNQQNIMEIMLFNFFMLVFGFLGETRVLNKLMSVGVGFIFFGLSFYKIWDNYAKYLPVTRNLYYFLITIWGLYGLSALMPVLEKNIAYNFLDIVSKNFYGLFIFYEIMKNRS